MTAVLTTDDLAATLPPLEPLTTAGILAFAAEEYRPRLPRALGGRPASMARDLHR
jgi:hypothetical protein